ncbi:hypothetical protein Q9233_012990 [Columba guinea]|nr:hypothetical protein Q9233_012990 [Columba guinea]
MCGEGVQCSGQLQRKILCQPHGLENKRNSYWKMLADNAAFSLGILPQLLQYLRMEGLSDHLVHVVCERPQEGFCPSLIYSLKDKRQREQLADNAAFSLGILPQLLQYLRMEGLSDHLVHVVCERPQEGFCPSLIYSLKDKRQREQLADNAAFSLGILPQLLQYLRMDGLSDHLVHVVCERPQEGFCPSLIYSLKDKRQREQLADNAAFSLGILPQLLQYLRMEGLSDHLVHVVCERPQEGFCPSLIYSLKDKRQREQLADNAAFSLGILPQLLQYLRMEGLSDHLVHVVCERPQEGFCPSLIYSLKDKRQREQLADNAAFSLGILPQLLQYLRMEGLSDHLVHVVCERPQEGFCPSLIYSLKDKRQREQLADNAAFSLGILPQLLQYLRMYGLSDHLVHVVCERPQEGFCPSLIYSLKDKRQREQLADNAAFSLGILPQLLQYLRMDGLSDHLVHVVCERPQEGFCPSLIYSLKDKRQSEQTFGLSTTVLLSTPQYDAITMRS